MEKLGHSQNILDMLRAAAVNRILPVNNSEPPRYLGPTERAQGCPPLSSFTRKSLPSLGSY